MVRCFVLLGAKVGTVDNDGDTAVLQSILTGRFQITQFLLEEAGAKMDDVNNNGEDIRDLLVLHLKQVARDDEAEHDFTALTTLMRVLVLRSVPPPALVAPLPLEAARVIMEGQRLRVWLTAFLARQRVLLDKHCPVLLPPLRALVRGYMEFASEMELWTTWLSAAP
jgi:hypothetical protein